MSDSSGSGAEGRPPPEDRIGQAVDRRYVIDGILGMGGLGVVYRARHKQLNRPVAIKLMHPEFASHTELRRRFDREAKALSALVHPNIVAITDFGMHEGSPFLTMELLEGVPLSERLSEGGPPPIEEVIEILRQVLVGLKAAHKEGVLHRDLKPGNIMLREVRDAPIHAVIVDFGLAKIADPDVDGPPDPTLTKLGTILGTPSYMSPEQAASEPADERADVYALGIILFEMLVGRCPFVHDNRMEVLRAHLATKVPKPESLRKGLRLSRELRAVLDKALEKDRDHRYSSAAEMLDAVVALPSPAATAPDVPQPAPSTPEEPFGSAETMQVRSSMIVDNRPTKRRSPGRGALIGFGLAFVVIGIGFAVSVFSGETSDTSDAAIDEGATPETSETSRTRRGPRPEATPRAPRPSATDPLAAGVPRRLRRYLRRVRRGNPLSRDQQRALRDYQREHMDDPRASLILAHDHTNQQWYGDATERYATVDRIDLSARGNRWMRDDLLTIAGHRQNGDRAAELVRTIYGPEARGEIERRLAEQSDLDDGARERLERLLRDLRR